MTLEDRIARIIESTTAEVVELVRADVMAKVNAALGAGAPFPPPIRAPQYRGPQQTQPRQARKILPCKVPGCGQPSKGPRFGYLCVEHRDLSKAKLGALLDGGTKPGKPARRGANGRAG